MEFLDFFGFLYFFLKLLWLLLKVTDVTTEHQKWPKINKNSIISPFFCQRVKKASAAGARSKPAVPTSANQMTDKCKACWWGHEAHH